MRVNDALIGLVLLLFAAAMVAYAGTFPSMPGQPFGPTLFPAIIGAGMALCGLILIVGGLRRRHIQGWVHLGDWVYSAHHLTNFLAVLLALALYVLLAHRLGFIVTAFVLVAALLVKLRRGRVASSLAIAAAAVAVVYVVFARMLLVPLPPGVLRGVVW